MKILVIIAIVSVLFSSTITMAFADQYDDAAAKCPTYECQQAIMYQKMNAAIASGYDPMQASIDQSNKAIRDAYALLEQGNESLDVEEYEQAIEYFARVLETSPSLEQKAAAHAGLGWSYYDLKDSKLAAHHLNQAREWSNEAASSTSVILPLIDSYITLEEWENALDAMTGFEEDEWVKSWISEVKEKIRTDKGMEKTRTTCGEGTIEMNGECVLDTSKSSSQSSFKEGTRKVSGFQKIIDFMDEPFLSLEKAVGGDGHKRPHVVKQVESQKDVIKSPYCWNIINFKVCIFS
jgi:tetratricopeptide (TPR) repeat protein